VAFRREKYVEFGGPSGGNGGRGGDVIIEVVDGLNTLIDYRYQQTLQGSEGHQWHGQGPPWRQWQRHRAQGCRSERKIFDEDRTTLIHDFTTLGEKFVLAEGGNGGFRQRAFQNIDQSRPAQMPIPAELGEETLDLAAALKTDRGRPASSVCPMPAKFDLFFPRSARAKPKIADYPFTTLHPQLGVVNADGPRVRASPTFPVLIEGAHEGAGLGDRFPRPRRALPACLLHLVDATTEHAGKAYKTVRAELESLCRHARPTRSRSSP